MPDALELSLLGPPRVTRGGVPVPLDTRKAVALLAFLAVSGELQGRDTLACLLWPDSPQTRARAALRRTLSVINRAGGDPALELAHDAVGLRGQGSHVDVLEFGALLSPCVHAPEGTRGCPACLPSLERAVDLYRGDFLAGFALRDSVAFDDWQAGQADELRQQLATGLDRLSAARAATGRAEQALAAARRWLALDPLHEPAHQRLMELYARTGQRSAALTQYRTCVRVLDAELGVPPLTQTTELYHRIREHSVPVRPPVTTPPRGRAVARPSALTLVGRAEHLATLHAGHLAAAPDGRLLAVTGEAGIGKTRLAEEVAAAARTAGSVLVVTRGHEEESGLPYGVVVSALRAAVLARPEALAGLPTAWKAELGQLLPDLLAEHTAASPGGGLAVQTRIYDAVTGLLTAVLAGDPPGLLVVDDAQWADDASLSVLAYLVRRLQGRSLAVLTAWRPAAGAAVQRLTAMLSGAAREGTGTRVELGRLTREDVAQLCSDATVASRLHEESEGLPFLVVEYLGMMAQDPSSARSWQLPRNVADLLRQRMLHVSEPAQQVLTAAAVAGREFRADVVRHASGRGEPETAAALEELLGCGLLRDLGMPDGSYAFTHDKLREVAYAAAGAGRRRRLHARVAEALSGRRDAAEQDALIGAHLRAAGEDDDAAQAFGRAAQRAFAVHAHAEAEAHAAAALALGHPCPAVLHELAADVATARGRYLDAASSYELAAARATGPALAQVERKLGELHARRGDHELADSHLRAALDLLGDDALPEARAAVLVARSLTAHGLGRPDLARRYGQEALVHAHEPAGLARVHNLLGLLANSAGEVDVGAAHLEEALAMAHGPASQELRVAALNNLSISRAAQGRLDDAVALVERALLLCQDLGDRHRQGALLSRLGDLVHRTGRHEQARAHVRSSVELLADVGEPGVLQPGIWMLEAW